MRLTNTFWPPQDERRLLGRFYLADGMTELFNVIWPFQFAFLFMVMQRPEWAVIPLLVHSLVALVMEIPTGAFADRYGRWLAVILGALVSAVAVALVPIAAHQSGITQFVSVSLCFGVWGLGDALMSGAEEAWVVDNLSLAGRSDLIDNYFARINSFTSLGAVGASGLALLLLLNISVSRAWLDALWVIAALGLILGAAIKLKIAERRPPPAQSTSRPPILAIMLQGLRALRRSRALLWFVLALVVASFPESVADDAFDMSLITKGMDARGLAPLGMVDNLIGMLAPLIGFALLRRFGATRILSLFLIIPALAVCVLFVSPLLGVVIALYILLDFFDCVWDPVAEAHLQHLIDSDNRATVTSIVSHAGGVMELAGIAVFALLLGQYSEPLSDSVPDLISAFSGEAGAAVEAPLSALGLAVPDLAIVVFMLAALLALPFIWLSSGARRGAAPD